MSYRSGFFNSTIVDGAPDRAYSAENFAEYFSLFIRNGVFANSATNLQVTARSPIEMGINVQAGAGWINGYYLIAEGSPAASLSIATASPVLNRIDAVVLGLNLSTRIMDLYVKTGTPSVNPVGPELTRSSEVWELKLAEVSVSAGSTGITQANITDTRADDAQCGWVKGLIDQIDTTELFAQYDDAFQTWFEEVKEQLSDDVAGHLLALIENLDERLTTIEAELPDTQNKVGDVKISTRSSLGSNWHECDGTALSFASSPNLQGLVPLTLENSELNQTSLNSILDGYELSTGSYYTGSRAPVIKFLNGYYVCAFTVKNGTDGQNVLYAYSQTLMGNWIVRVLDSQIATSKNLGIIDVDYLNGEYVFTCGYYNPFSLRIYHATNLSDTFTYKALLDADCVSGYTRDYNGGIAYGNGYYVAYANFHDGDGGGRYYLKRTASLNSTGWESFGNDSQARCSALYFDSEINKFVWTHIYARAGYTSYNYIYAKGISDSTRTQIAQTEDLYTSLYGNKMKKLNGQYIVYPSLSPSASDTETSTGSVYPVPNYRYISNVSPVGSWIEAIDGKLYSLRGKKGFAIRDSNSLPGTITEGAANELIADNMLYSGFVTKEDDFICIIGMTTDGKIGKWVSSGKLPELAAEGVTYYIKTK